jgi:acetylornithine deacetylase
MPWSGDPEMQPASVALLAELVAQPSLLGDEAGAQVLMAREFASLGLRVHEFEVDEVSAAPLDLCRGFFGTIR